MLIQQCRIIFSRTMTTVSRGRALCWVVFRPIFDALFSQKFRRCLLGYICDYIPCCLGCTGAVVSPCVLVARKLMNDMDSRFGYVGNVADRGNALVGAGSMKYATVHVIPCGVCFVPIPPLINIPHTAGIVDKTLRREEIVICCNILPSVGA